MYKRQVDAVLELDTEAGRILARQFLNAMNQFGSESTIKNVGVAYRVLPSTKVASSTTYCNHLITMGESGVDAAKASLDEQSTIDKSKGTSAACSALPYLDTSLPATNFLSANGRVWKIDGESLTSADIQLMIDSELDQSKQVTALLQPFINPADPYSGISRAAAFLSASQEDFSRTSPVESMAGYEKQFGLEDNPFKFTWNDSCEIDECLQVCHVLLNLQVLIFRCFCNLLFAPPLCYWKTSVTAIVDPTTETAQRLSPLLKVIRDDLRLPLTLFLAPTSILDDSSKIPISSYYRFVTDLSAHQDERSPEAVFSNLPHDHTLTIRMDTPEPWDIQQKMSVQDTDNLRCDLQSGCSDEGPNTKVPMHKQQHRTRVEYELSHLLLFGQCYETNPLTPPNGLQLTLSRDNQGTEQSESTFSDTLVMKTVGYWQLRANPGVWNVNILKGSKGDDIFQIVEGKIKRGTVEVTSVSSENTKKVVMGDFVSRSSTLLVKRNEGFEKAKLFSPDTTVATDDDTVHVFSLATGHLYERFLKIMMLSVTKRTSSKVKFWLFENFLSPTFKESATAMAKEIGCELEFVTYKWPEFLREQTEKQRIIWGYKILFLDVLFPLHVKKIIYVDADQVIRGDLKELWDMDLQDAPYGYTPMCSSREETVGFAFWKTGFWESHLQGKPYHISALYVVDLERFRKTLVGDQLRSIYQQLSADPNSLANLDQDLPNYAQHQVPIFSLPQEWLWCESWCSDDTKALAKTIDLCNNPLYKEPKVTMAKRVISGDLFEESWVELDAEVDKYEQDYRSSLI